MLEAEECHQVHQQTILSVSLGWSKYKKTIITKAATLQTLEFNLNPILICSKLVQKGSLFITHLKPRSLLFEHPEIHTQLFYEEVRRRR